jgi:hypothetical protein
VDCLPLSFIESVAFLTSLEPCYQIPSRFYFADKVIPALSAQVKATVQTKLFDCPCVSLTNDIWTASSNNDSYLSLTAHFIDSSFVYHRFILNVKHFPGSHTGDIADNVTKILQEWNLTDVHLIVTDEGANMKAGIEKTQLPRRPSPAHLPHRVVTDIIFTQPSVVNVLTICHSIASRWNSTYVMIERMVEQQKAIVLYGLNTNLTLPNPSQWALLSFKFM